LVAFLGRRNFKRKDVMMHTAGRGNVVLVGSSASDSPHISSFVPQKLLIADS
jgi:hypothetical protein